MVEIHAGAACGEGGGDTGGRACEMISRGTLRRGGKRGFPLIPLKKIDITLLFFREKFAYMKKKQYFCSQNMGNRFRESPYFGYKNRMKIY